MFNTDLAAVYSGKILECLKALSVKLESERRRAIICSPKEFKGMNIPTRIYYTDCCDEIDSMIQDIAFPCFTVEFLQRNEIPETIPLPMEFRDGERGVSLWV